MSKELFLVVVNLGECINDNEKLYSMLIDRTQTVFVLEFMRLIEFLFSLAYPIRLQSNGSYIHELEDIRILSLVDRVDVVLVKDTITESRAVLFDNALQWGTRKQNTQLIELGRNESRVPTMLIRKLQAFSKSNFDTSSREKEIGIKANRDSVDHYPGEKLKNSEPAINIVQCNIEDCNEQNSVLDEKCAFKNNLDVGSSDIQKKEKMQHQENINDIGIANKSSDYSDKGSECFMSEIINSPRVREAAEIGSEKYSESNNKMDTFHQQHQNKSVNKKKVFHYPFSLANTLALLRVDKQSEQKKSLDDLKTEMNHSYMSNESLCQQDKICTFSEPLKRKRIRKHRSRSKAIKLIEENDSSKYCKQFSSTELNFSPMPKSKHIRFTDFEQNNAMNNTNQEMCYEKFGGRDQLSSKDVADLRSLRSNQLLSQSHINDCGIEPSTNAEPGDKENEGKYFQNNSFKDSTLCLEVSDRITGSTGTLFLGSVGNVCEIENNSINCNKIDTNESALNSLLKLKNSPAVYERNS